MADHGSRQPKVARSRRERTRLSRKRPARPKPKGPSRPIPFPHHPPSPPELRASPLPLPNDHFSLRAPLGGLRALAVPILPTDHCSLHTRHFVSTFSFPAAADPLVFRQSSALSCPPHPPTTQPVGRAPKEGRNAFARREGNATHPPTAALPHHPALHPFFLPAL
jgi:hypothetical protein